MTWGTQNTADEAFAQIDFALDHGINILDTAEMYPTTPMSAETFGETERIIGRWLARGGRRSQVILATKITGVGNRLAGRDGAPISPATVRAALEGSLRRLGTDYVDLYQLHWPNRGSYHFRQSWNYAPERQPRGQAEEMLAILETIAALKAEGKLRQFGLSNETAWGTGALPRSRRPPRPAPGGFDPERIQSDVPAVRSRPRRALPPRRGRAARLFAAGRRLSHRQIRRRRPAPRLARRDQRRSRRPDLGAFRAGRRRPMSPSRANTASIRRRWRSPSPRAGRSWHRSSSAPPRWTSCAPISRRRS